MQIEDRVKTRLAAGNKPIPEECRFINPLEVIKAHVESEGKSYKDFMDFMPFHTRYIDNLRDGTGYIGDEFAEHLQCKLDIDSEYWLDMQRFYDRDIFDYGISIDTGYAHDAPFATVTVNDIVNNNPILRTRALLLNLLCHSSIDFPLIHDAGRNLFKGAYDNSNTHDRFIIAKATYLFILHYFKIEEGEIDPYTRNRIEEHFGQFDTDMLFARLDSLTPHMANYVSRRTVKDNILPLTMLQHALYFLIEKLTYNGQDRE